MFVLQAEKLDGGTEQVCLSVFREMDSNRTQVVCCLIRALLFDQVLQSLPLRYLQILSYVVPILQKLKEALAMPTEKQPGAVATVTRKALLLSPSGRLHAGIKAVRNFYAAVFLERAGRAAMHNAPY